MTAETKFGEVHFVDVGLVAKVPAGSTLLEASAFVGAPHGSHCGGVCACSACHVFVVSGTEQLSPMQPDEEDVLEFSAKEVSSRSRLGCQAELAAGSCVEVRISEESFEAFLDDHPEQREQAIKRWLKRPAEALDKLNKVEVSRSAKERDVG